MRNEKTEGVRGWQDDGSSRTRVTKVISRCTADGRNQKTGDPKKGLGSDIRSGRIHSVTAGTGSSVNSGFWKRLEWEVGRNRLFSAKELVEISTCAGWIRDVCEDIFSRRAAAYILGLLHLPECLSDTLKAILPDEAERSRRLVADKARLKDNRTFAVIADFRSHADRHENAANCVRHLVASVSRMQCKSYLERGMHIGSGAVQHACRSLVCMRIKRSGNHWSVAGQIPLCR
ncbi:MAG: hypothetical protein OXH79_23300 [Boseongicola sp.]|nr:hypothetical protein [Boseongicola sp.]